MLWGFGLKVSLRCRILGLGHVEGIEFGLKVWHVIVSSLAFGLAFRAQGFRLKAYIGFRSFGLWSRLAASALILRV